jgi:hypothetical protein
LEYEEKRNLVGLSPELKSSFLLRMENVVQDSEKFNSEKILLESNLKIRGQNSNEIKIYPVEWSRLYVLTTPQKIG